MRRCTLVFAAVGAFLLGISAASAKLPPLDLSAPDAVPFGVSVPVRLWFVDGDGVLPASEVQRWGLPERVGGWVWAYPEEDGRPDPDHPGLRVPLVWSFDHYEGRFRPDEPGPWLVVPFGAHHSMPDPLGPAEPIHVFVGRVRGTVMAPAPARVGSIAGPLTAIGAASALLGALSAASRRRRVVAR